MSDYLFVYGTLRKNRDGRLHAFLQGQADYIGMATMPGKLYALQNYPGAVTYRTNGSPRIHGEIYRLHAAKKLLRTLDEYEECTEHFPAPHEYRRRRISVSLSDNRLLTAWVYLYNRPVTGLEPIACGDYPQYLQNRQTRNHA